MYSLGKVAWAVPGHWHEQLGEEEDGDASLLLSLYHPQQNS